MDRDETLCDMYRAILRAPESWSRAVTKRAAEAVCDSDPRAYAALMGTLSDTMPSDRDK